MSFTTTYTDGILGQITTSNSLDALNHTFKVGINRETRENILSSFLSNGQDPLEVLDPRTYTLGVLWLLSSRLNANFTQYPPPPWQVVVNFCASFNPEHARRAPERVTKLAKGIQRTAAHIDTPSIAIRPLFDLVTRYAPSPSYLTTIHPIFMLVCVSTRNFQPTLPLFSSSITTIDTTTLSPDLTYNDNLIYHYTGGIALAAMKKWKEAEEYFEVCVTAPGTYPAALQMEALKKLRLVQLINSGKISPLPKYTSQHLLRIFKGTPYQSFINAYPKDVSALKEIAEEGKQVFTTDKNIGLITQAINRAPRWILKKLTATYVTLHLSDIARAVKIDDEEEVRSILLNMIESNDIHAHLSASGTVTFSDPPPTYTRAQVDAVLRAVQEQAGELESLDGEIGRGKEFLGKIVKSNDSWAPTAEEEIFANLTAGHVWDENVF